MDPALHLTLRESCEFGTYATQRRIEGSSITLEIVTAKDRISGENSVVSKIGNCGIE
jgi:hypothetical protein